MAPVLAIHADGGNYFDNMRIDLAATFARQDARRPGLRLCEAVEGSQPSVARETMRSVMTRQPG